MKKFNKIQIFHKQEDYAVEYNDTELLQMAMAKDSDVIELAEKATDKVLDQIDDPGEWPLIRYRNFTDTVYEFRGKLTQHRYRTKDLLKSDRDVCMLMINVKTNSLIRKKLIFLPPRLRVSFFPIGLYDDKCIVIFFGLRTMGMTKLACMYVLTQRATRKLPPRG